ncbi:MAG: nucleoid occlusion protein [Sporomusaceae bacterium]|nr:nucleoid occlusion protein [Sporomusaceae bacterium]
MISIKSFAKFLGLSTEKTAPVEPVVMAEVPEIESAPREKAAAEVIFLAVSEIVPNPFQPRKTFSDEALAELSASIREFGVIQPLLVRKTADHYELIAGERRLRASKLAEQATVPVIVKELTDKEMAELAMIENLQREDLHFLEEAEGFYHLIQNFGLTQENLAQRVGKNQSTIANKLRLLKLSEPVRKKLQDENLTERHARALLKVSEPEQQENVLAAVIEHKMNVRETEDYIENFSREIEAAEKPRQNVVKVIRDVRIFLNSINKVVGEMKKTGLKVKMNQAQSDEYITIELKIPKRIQQKTSRTKKKS